MLIAQKAFDFIIAQEVTSRAVYESRYQRPQWPGGASGITIAIGYDLGYATVDKINVDWSGHVSYAMLQALKSCAGVKGAEAHALLPSVKNAALIPWDAAIDVFANRDIPAWTATVQHTLANTDKVSPLCLGCLVSTAYNRGVGGFTAEGDRYRELHLIRQYMAQQNFKPVSDQFRSMTRLWPNAKGLRNRYIATAALWDEGLAEPANPK